MKKLLLLLGAIVSVNAFASATDPYTGWRVYVSQVKNDRNILVNSNADPITGGFIGHDPIYNAKSKNYSYYGYMWASSYGNEGKLHTYISDDDQIVGDVYIEQRDIKNGQPQGYDECKTIETKNVNSYVCYKFVANPNYTVWTDNYTRQVWPWTRVTFSADAQQTNYGGAAVYVEVDHE